MGDGLPVPVTYGRYNVLRLASHPNEMPMFTYNPAAVTEIAPDVFRFSLFARELNLQFNYFLVRDEQPLLFTTGYRASFPLLREAVARVIDPATIRWVSFSHFESDECGALNDWLQIAPNAQAICSQVGAAIAINDFASRPPRPMADGEVINTGKRRFRFIRTPHVPHCWDAGLLFEETNAALLCSDLFHQMGDVEAVTQSDVVGRARETLTGYNQGPFSNYMPYTPQTQSILDGLASLTPATVATMHGSAFAGDGEQALRDLATMMRETLG